METLTNFPEQIRQGYTTRVRLSFPDSQTGGHPVSIVIAGEHVKEQIAATAEGNGDYLFEFLPSVTQMFQAGNYGYEIFASDGAEEVYQLRVGLLEVCETISTGFDHRNQLGHGQRVLEAIEAVIEGKATTDQSNFAVNGRSLSRYSWDELLAARSKYTHIAAQERQAERLRQGLPGGRRIVTRFVPRSGSAFRR